MSPSENMNDPRPGMDEDEGIDLSEYLGMLIENRWLIGGVTALFTAVALVYALFATPIYQADALVQIEQGKGRLGGSDELAMLMGGTETSSSSTEIEILKSRNVLGDVVEKAQLTIGVQPRRFPLIGDYFARKDAGRSEPVAPWLGAGSYAWGGERLRVSRFEVPSPGAAFTLVAGDAGGFVLLDGEGEEILRGKAGEAAAGSDGQVRIFVSELVARSGTQFFVSKLDHFAVVRSLQGQLQIAEKGRGTGLLAITLAGADRERIRTIVQELSRSYLRQNVERRSAESEKMLEFINQQMPVMRAELDAAEQALNLYRERSGTIDLSIESQNLIQRVTNLETEISALGIERAELLQKLTDSHPVIQGIDEKLQRLQEQMERLEGQLKTVPEKELESVKLSRDVKVASELYMLLLNKSQELKVTKAGTLGNVRIVDEAVVGSQPIKPKRGRIVLLSLLLGLIFGVVIAVLRKALNKAIEDPSVVEKQLGIPVYAEIPFSEYQEKMIRESRKRSDRSGLELLAHTKPDDQVIESLRSLRTSLQFALMEAENNLVTISGPAPEVGKSFVSANFAYLMATSGKKILLIDADMRKGHLAAYFKVAKNPGISEALSGESAFEAAVHRGALHENLDFLATGVYPPNPSELLMSEAFKALLASVSQQYDLVIIDTPPVLAVTDAAIVGQYASTNFMLLRSGRHHLREIQTAFRRFEQNGVPIKGAIFNGVELSKGRYGGKYGYGYKYYAYQYDYK
jgi:tyrosine-protein kinase Etk/Wzc